MTITGTAGTNGDRGLGARPDETTWHPRLRRLYAYWRSIQSGAATLPGRQHVDPAEIREILPWIWLTDIQRDPLRFRYRLLGTAHYEPMRGDFTGRWMDEAHPNFTTSHVYGDYVALAEQGVVSYRKGRPIFHVDSDFLLLERLQLPLATDGRTVDMMIGCTVYMTRNGDDC